MSNLTPVNLIALTSLLKGQGLSMNRDLVNAIDKFSNHGVSGSIKRKISTASSQVKKQLEFAPSFLTGIFPSGIAVPENLDKYDLVGGIKTTAESLISGGISKFVFMFSQAETFASKAYSAHGELEQARVKQFEDFGFQFNNFQDMITGGVTSQFAPETISAIANEFQNLGNAFDIRDLSKMFTPGGFCKNLINQGLGNVGSLQKKLTQAGVDITDLENADDTVIRKVLSTTDENDVKNMQILTGLKPYKPLCCFEEALEISYLFSPKISSKINSLKVLSDKLVNIGGNFKDPSELASFYGSVEIPNIPNLNKIKTPSPSDLLTDLADKTKETNGYGVGPFSNPRITDIIGSVAGIGYADDLIESANMQEKLLTIDSDVIAFKTYIDSTADHNPDILANLIKNINAKPTLQNTLNTFNSKIINSSSRLVMEISNRKAAGIDPQTATDSEENINNFINQISNIAADNLDIGTSLQITRMVTDDVYGESVIASLLESRNLNRLDSVNITVTNKMNAMAYAKQLRSMI